MIAMMGSAATSMRRLDAVDLSARARPRSVEVMMDDASADEPLLAAYCAGADGAATRLFVAYAPTVRAVIARYLARRLPGRSELAEDLTHEVFLALFADDGRRLRHFEGRNGCSFAGWLRVVAVRLAIDLLRRERRLVALDDETPAMIELRRSLRSDAPDPADSAEAAETAARLAGELDALGAKDRLLVELHLVRGVGLPEVARALGVSANAAYVRKSRILKSLRRSLEERR
jgi:RNA polymerase sigma factor (sigma-70 family)